MDKTSGMNKESKIACVSAGGSLGLAALAGACTTGCGVMAAPLFGLLTSIGFGSVATFLPSLRLPLIGIALVLGAYAMWSFVKRKNAVGAAVCGCLLGAGGIFLGFQAMQANDCKSASTVENVLRSLTPETKLVLQKGVYPMWPELGRAPTIEEIRARLGFGSQEQVLAAFRELEGMGFRNIFYPGTKNIKWFWPFSSLDHGIVVVLEGEKPVHARCSIDALGMSAMFGKRAKLAVKTPLDGRQIEIEIDGNKIVSANQEAVASYSDSCDDMLFFASKDEFSRYVKQTGKSYLKLFSLKEALAKGVESFGKALKV